MYDVTFGPQHDQVVSLLERARVLTADEIVRLREVWLASGGPSENVAIAASESGRLDPFVAAGDAAKVAAAQACRAIEGPVADERSWDFAWYAVRDSAQALVVRDLVGQHGLTVEDYDGTTAPWRTVVGPVHPDDTDTGTDILSVESGRDALCELVIDPRIDRLTRPMIQMGIDAIDRAVAEVERLRAQVAELLPWAEAAADARVEAAVGDRHHDAVDLLARIEAGEFGT
jgi:hypothetical protein